jgi:Porin PorA
MRRIVGLVFLALGVALIALAVALPTFVYPRVEKVPADPNEFLVAQGSGVTVLLAQSPEDGGIRVLTNQNVVATRYIRGDVRPNATRATGDNAFYRLAFKTTVENQPNGLLTAYVEGGSINGKTGLSNNCCGDFLSIDTTDTVGEPIRHEGLQWKFPFDTKKQNYPFWDVNVKKALTANYVGTERIDGLLTYRFVQPITDIVISQEDVPGSLLGLPEQASVRADRLYSDTRTLWIEPYTGAIIKGSEQVNQRLVSNGKQAPVIQGTLTYTDATVRHNVDEYKGKARSLWFIKQGGPIAFWILGPLFVLIGLLLLLFRRETPGAAEDARAGEGTPEDGDARTADAPSGQSV